MLINKKIIYYANLLKLHIIALHNHSYVTFLLLQGF